MATYLHSAFYRNGEDIVFFDQAFHELALSIATGAHRYSYELSNLGWHLYFDTPTYHLEILYDYGTNGAGSGKILVKK